MSATLRQIFHFRRLLSSRFRRQMAVTPVCRSVVQLFVEVWAIEPAVESLRAVQFAAELGPAFRGLVENVIATVSVATIPWKQQRQTFFEQFVKNTLPLERRKEPSLPQSDLHPKVKRLMVQRFQEYCDSEEGRKSLSEKIYLYLGFSLERGTGLQAQHLLRQTAVSTWTALEVFFEDLVRVLLVERTAAAVNRLLGLSEVKKLFERDIRDFDFESLAELGFDSRSAAQKVFLDSRRLDHLYNVRKACSALFPNNVRLTNALGSEDLRLLFFRRNLIVHRASVVDQNYLRETGEKLTPGVSLDLSSAFVESSIKAVIEAASSLLEAASYFFATER
jgi:hypothetical protein